MPKTYPPLTPKEKSRVLTRHKQLVEAMNKALPAEERIGMDIDLIKRLDDPKFVAAYRIGEEMGKKRAKQEEILAKMREKYGHGRLASNPLNRVIQYEFDVTGTPEADAYNEKLYKDYLDDPEKIVFLRYGPLLRLDPSLASSWEDDPLKAAEFYRDTYPLCERCHNFSNVIAHAEANPELKAAASLFKPIEMMGAPVDLVRVSGDLDCLAFPRIKAKQAALICKANPDFGLTMGEAAEANLLRLASMESEESPKAFFGKFAEKGIPLEAGMFLDKKPVSYSLDEQGNMIDVKEIDYDAYFDAPDTAKVKMLPRSEKERFALESMNKPFASYYLKKWQEEFNSLRGKEGPFDLNRIEEEHKGGFFERYIRRSTSREYLDFLQAFKNYNDPESPDFLDKGKLKEKGDGYLRRKTEQGYSDVSKMNVTSASRTKFVLVSMKACDALPPVDELARAWDKEYDEPQKKSFLSEEEVDLDASFKEEGIENETDNELREEISLAA